MGEFLFRGRGNARDVKKSISFSHYSDEEIIAALKQLADEEMLVIVPNQLEGLAEDQIVYSLLIETLEL